MLAAVLAMLPDIGDVEERCTVKTDFHESALHAGQYPRNAPEINIADQTARALPLDVQLLHNGLFEHRYAGFLRRYVDQDLVRHRMRHRRSIAGVENRRRHGYRPSHGHCAVVAGLPL